jgi:hypothetical protein
MTQYKLTVFKPEDDDDDPSWDANDWCYIVHHADDSDDIICICATEDEAKHILALLEASPYDATAATSQ